MGSYVAGTMSQRSLTGGVRGKGQSSSVYEAPVH